MRELISGRPRIEYDCGMAALPNSRMTVDEYLVWTEQQLGRFELLDGTVIWGLRLVAHAAALDRLPLEAAM